ncbi:MAG TPA: universal stress protein, partial [Candidatus Dormibacteraeota bacterium]|nr:universal stress protein [Candidatus Dormibacteraeota bacterium]
LHTRPRVLVPVLMGQMARPIISVGDALASTPGASGNLLALVEIRSGRDNEVFAQERRRRDLLLWVAGLEYSSEIRRRMGVSLRLTANVASSIRDAIAEYETTSLILEWPTTASARRHGLADLTRQLLADGSTDLVFVRSNPRNLNQSIAPRSILASIRGGPGARAVAFAASALADVFGSVLTLLHIQTGAQHPDRSRREWNSFEEIVTELNRPGTIVTLRRRDSAAGAILEEAAGHDLVMIGSRVDPTRPNMLIGRDLDRMLRHLEAPVVMIRAKPSSRPDVARPAPTNGHRA